MTTPDDRWDDDNLQFPRLLAELRAIGLSLKQYGELAESMDLDSDLIDDILERAEVRWQQIKEEL